MSVSWCVDWNAGSSPRLTPFLGVRFIRNTPSTQGEGEVFATPRHPPLRSRKKPKRPFYGFHLFKKLPCTSFLGVRFILKTLPSVGAWRGKSGPKKSKYSIARRGPEWSAAFCCLLLPFYVCRLSRDGLPQCEALFFNGLKKLNKSSGACLLASPKVSRNNRNIPPRLLASVPQRLPRIPNCIK